MTAGTICYFNAEAGFAFVHPDGVDPGDRSKDAYVHPMAIARAGLRLRKGDRIEFDVVPSKTKPNKFEAQRVRAIAA